MWKHFVDSMVSRFIREGELTIDYPDGTRGRYGAGGGLSVSIKIREEATLRRLSLDPELTLGEGYMSGEIEVADDDLYTLLTLLLRNRRAGAMPRWARIADGVRQTATDFVQRNTPDKAQRNISHHYDISNDLYRLLISAEN